jgi:hypothetical protein
VFKIISIAAVLALTGCGQQPSSKLYSAPLAKKSPQQLVVDTVSKSSELKKREKSNDYILKLNNTTHSKGDLILGNNGGEPLEIKNIKISSKYATLFSLQNGCSSVLNPREKCTLNIDFLGNNAGDFDAMVEVTTNDPKREIANIAINAKAINRYSAAVKQIESETVKVDKVVTLNFNTANKTQYLEIKNNGFETLSLGQPAIKGADKASFSIAKNTCNAQLKVNDTCEVTINYEAKKDGISGAKLILPSNGDITPSDYVRLEGFSKPYNINIEKFVVSKNVKEFLNDYFTSSNKYAFRTIFQQKTDRGFEAAVDSEIKKYFKENDYNLVQDSSNADTIITLYPSVSIAKDSTGRNFSYNIVVNGHITSKSKFTSTDKAVAEYKTSSTQFTSIGMNNLIVDKEDFEFAMVVNADSVSDEIDLGQTVADIMTSKVFNVIGLKDTKGDF